MRRPLVLALAATLALSAGRVAANATATAELSDFQLQLIDLDPDDGIAPSFDMTGFVSQAVAGIFPDSTERDGDSAFAPVRNSTTDGRGNTASVDIGDLLAGGTARVSATAVGDAEPQAFGIFGDSEGRTFTLAPHTELLVRGWADVSGHFDAGDPREQEAAASITLYFGGEQSNSAGAVTMNFAPDFGPPSLDMHQALSGVFYNDTDSFAQETFRFDLTGVAFVGPGASPVPEPVGALAWLAPLAALGMLLRRRGGRSASRQAAATC